MTCLLACIFAHQFELPKLAAAQTPKVVMIITLSTGSLQEESSRTHQEHKIVWG